MHFSLVVWHTVRHNHLSMFSDWSRDRSVVNASIVPRDDEHIPGTRSRLALWKCHIPSYSTGRSNGLNIN